MVHDEGQLRSFPFSLGHFRHIAAVGAVVLAGLLTVCFAPPAEALPSFARQTGQPCGTCHTDFPALTPFGRRFKLLGYTTGGGKFRTTPWPGAEDFRAAADRLRGFVKAPDSGQEEADKVWVPPVSMMAVAGYTHTQAPLTPPSAPYSTNENWVLSPVSGFWGGAVTDHIGAFAHAFCSIYRGAYFEHAASPLAWTCETSSPPTCADCGTSGASRRTILPMRPR
jgi:hypothetical protein